MSVVVDPSRASTRSAAGSPTPAADAIRLAGALTAGYLAIATLPIWLHATAAGRSAPLIAHLAVLAYAWAALSRRAPRPVLDWLPLTVGPFMYVEMRWLIEGIGKPHRDALVAEWESRLFPSDPSATLAPQWAILPLSELLHLAYASYYLLVYLPPLALYLRGRHAAFASTMLALTLVYGACFVIYPLFPVDGPRYLAGPAAAPEGAIRSFVLALLEQGSSRGTAFPSSHVAASVVAALCALQHQRRVGVPTALTAAALTLATVYGGFHYAVDAVAGALLGVLSWAGASALARRGVRAESPHPG